MYATFELRKTLMRCLVRILGFRRNFRRKPAFDACTCRLQAKKKHRDLSPVLDFLLLNSVVGRE